MIQIVLPSIREYRIALVRKSCELFACYARSWSVSLDFDLVARLWEVLQSSHVGPMSSYLVCYCFERDRDDYTLSACSFVDTLSSMSSYPTLDLNKRLIRV